MNKLICKIFGHKWRYFFNSQNAEMQHTEIRVCSRCMKTQQWYKLPMLPTTEELWMNMIGRTKLGAKKYFGKKI